MPAFRHITFGLAAIAWGIVPVWFYAADRIRHYLDPDFHTIALCGGLGMIVLGLFNILTAGESADRATDRRSGSRGDCADAGMAQALPVGLQQTPGVLVDPGVVGGQVVGDEVEDQPDTVPGQPPAQHLQLTVAAQGRVRPVGGHRVG